MRSSDTNFDTASYCKTALEVLIKLSTIRAKLFFRTEVLEEDCGWALRLYEEMIDNQQSSADVDQFVVPKKNLFEKQEDWSVEANAPKAGKGAGPKRSEIDKSNIGGLSKPKQTKVFLDQLELKIVANDSPMFHINDLKIIGRTMRMDVGDFQYFIDDLNYKGLFIKKANSIYEYRSSAI
jgi:DNA replicative helicase MCM subunit Mcm2 (Cdc46/Mcm family)